MNGFKKKVLTIGLAMSAAEMPGTRVLRQFKNVEMGSSHCSSPYAKSDYGGPMTSAAPSQDREEEYQKVRIHRVWREYVKKPYRTRRTHIFSFAADISKQSPARRLSTNDASLKAWGTLKIDKKRRRYRIHGWQDQGRTQNRPHL